MLLHFAIIPQHNVADGRWLTYFGGFAGETENKGIIVNVRPMSLPYKAPF